MATGLEAFHDEAVGPGDGVRGERLGQVDGGDDRVEARTPERSLTRRAVRAGVEPDGVLAVG
ncbi:hypothetical protein AB0368_37295 [Actinoplanes sp. NPDC051475]|uniref:hypothetical protein n=1 Tax=Actinoplanes sp. NPDC051475 TaxID=3157225 RepID=UPI00344EE8F2